MFYECRHIMPNGNKCHAPALRAKPYCYFHSRLHTARKAPAPAANVPLKLGVLEDKCAIQVAVAQVLDALGSSRIDPRQAGIFLYGIQLVSQNVERRQDVIPFCAVESMTTTRGGDEMGPAMLVCKDGDDCSTCPHRDICKIQDQVKEMDDDEDIRPS
jgi:hypothetical protein